METTVSKRVLRRRRSRGVAMVEAGILAPVFAMMMMMTIYLGGVYNAKYRSFVKSRNYTWYYASSGCSTSLGGNTGSAGNGNQAQGAPSDPCGQASAGTATSSLGIATGNDTETWAYGPTLRFNGGQQNDIKTESFLVCNEKKTSSNFFGSLGGQLGSWFSQIKGGNSPCN